MNDIIFFKKLLLFLALSSFGLLTQAAKNTDIVATVNSKALTLGEFNKKLTEVRTQTLNPPSKEEFLEDLVRYYVGLQEAEKRGLRNDPAIKEKMEQELYKGLLEKTLGPEVAKINVTDEQMKAWYKRSPEIRISHILIEIKPNSKPEEVESAKKRAQEIYDKEIKKSKRPFEELVRLFSDDPLSKQTGGDIGWHNRLTLVPSYYEAVYKMKIGEIKGLIETPFGFHIVKLTGRNSYDNANKRQIRTAVFDELRRQKFNNYFDKLKKSYTIKTNSQFTKATNNADVIATINSKAITLGEFNKKFNELRSQTLSPPTKEEFLEDLVRYYVGLQEAEKRGLRNDPEVKEKMEQELYKGLLEKTLGPEVAKIKVNDEQMKAWYKSNPEVRTSHILIEFKPTSKPEEIALARKRAQEIYDKEVKNSKRPFEELVRLFSDDTLSKQTGGDIGWQNRLTLVPNYYETVLKMKVGEIKGLIETPFGFHIVKLTGRNSFDDANKRQIRTAVFDELRRQKFNQYFDQLKKNYAIKTNPQLIR